MTLMVVSILVSLSFGSLPKYKVKSVDDELLNMSYLLEGTQMKAQAESSSFTVNFDRKNNKIIVRDAKRSEVNGYKLDICKLQNYGLEQFSYNTLGDTTAFGTVYMICDKKNVKIVMQIQKGRFRIEK
ncbi:hypothetical protein JEM45_02270 [Jeotgalicoccus sp. ATCC 8456]|nr:hypothetical protein [Jeotgalicoccus sp. ATCC 8456]QQD85473.1 hypothetical protein JEM45_02270 [Jeotgalicoccus sp. ATCC 8456]